MKKPSGTTRNRSCRAQFERSRERNRDIAGRCLDGRTSTTALDAARHERLIFKTSILLAAALPTPALAHPGHLASGFTAGLLHPLTGVDHLLAMLMVGLCAGLAFPRRWWICPAAFVAFMLAGFGYGAAGGAFLAAEMLILASLAILGLTLLFDIRPPLAIAAPIAAIFAIAHGFAHGAEMPAGGDARGFIAGFIVATALLHAAGLVAAWNAHRLGRAVGAVATTAAAMMWSS